MPEPPPPNKKKNTHTKNAKKQKNAQVSSNIAIQSPGPDPYGGPVFRCAAEGLGFGISRAAAVGRGTYDAACEPPKM